MKSECWHPWFPHVYMPIPCENLMCCICTFYLTCCHNKSIVDIKQMIETKVQKFVLDGLKLRGRTCVYFEIPSIDLAIKCDEKELACSLILKVSVRQF